MATEQIAVLIGPGDGGVTVGERLETIGCSHDIEAFLFQQRLCRTTYGLAVIDYHHLEAFGDIKTGIAGIALAGDFIHFTCWYSNLHDDLYPYVLY